MTALDRTKQGQFTLEHCLDRDDWDADKIFDAIERTALLQANEAEAEA
eukprot:CAMPEP_0183313060 /NCGR_PEP_ID=MMETSP0160_2-20130417/43950_1 /TAXON_ID=2839 ORGANISM="Odontella Sinensis, Strain Grunow 1884" /NCGR_SAMPLE_ID=MMETSP0160_2 /ASSEMBLY_ACC=CAM_ASM_000250 /LENGTH=47 /DNA_ID= /DNA_START= /DNA_END= /DNA_ORIENTATION=